MSAKANQQTPVLALTEDATGVRVGLTASFPPTLLEAIAQRAAEIIGTAADDRWLDAKSAAEHLAVPVSTLHKLSAAREVPFSQDAPGGKLYFKRSQLDAWREGR